MIRKRVCSVLSVSLVFLFLLGSSPGGAQSERHSKNSSVDARAVSLVEQLKADKDQAGIAWKRLSVEEKQLVLGYVHPQFYTEGKQADLVAISSSRPAKKIAGAVMPSSTDDWGGDYYVDNVYSCGAYNTFVTFVRGNGPGKLTLSYQKTVSNKWSANVGISASGVSAGVGFDVTHSESMTYSYETEVPGGHQWEIDAYNVFDGVTFDIYWDPWVGDPYYVGYGDAYQFVGVDYWVWQVY